MFEQETQMMINGIFLITIFTVIVVLILLYLKTKNNRLFWYLGSLIGGSIGYYFLNILLFVDRNIPQPMISEENSLTISLSALFGVIGVLFLLIGIWRNSKLINVIR